MNTVSKKRIHQSFAGLGLTLSIVLATSASANAITIPPLTNPCTGVGKLLTGISDLLPFELFDRGYDCGVNPPDTDPILP